MNKKTFAKITWILTDKMKEIPKSIKYSTVASFNDIEDKYPKMHHKNYFTTEVNLNYLMAKNVLQLEM